ncbi:hypothetical protein HK102_007816, partial [Quaeritorhiza haematococci]
MSWHAADPRYQYALGTPSTGDIHFQYPWTAYSSVSTVSAASSSSSSSSSNVASHGHRHSVSAGSMYSVNFELMEQWAAAGTDIDRIIPPPAY